VFAVRVGVLVVAALTASCVNLRYPPGASRDGGPLLVHAPNGHACTKATDCASGNCDDGFCCKTDCSQPCYSCALTGSLGVCMPAAANTNPRGACMDQGASSCGTNGVCDGAGNCQTYAAGTICQQASCVSHQAMLASRCSADGGCVPGEVQSCTPYLCDVGAKCLTTCQTNDDCANGHLCDVDGGSCGKKALGTACADPTECDSGFCAQGVCCATNCAGGCLSCAIGGSEGACMPLTEGTAPQDPTFCAASDVSTCGLDGTCDGAGACRNFPAGTVCNPPSCSTATLRPPGTCDGNTHCQTPTTTSCGGFTCASATACKTTCASDLDCAAPSVCGAGACGGLSAQYFRQTNLTDLAFSRTDPQINFNWGLGSPSPALAADSFSIRWHGKITARFTDVYTFTSATDDGDRLIIGGQTIINDFVRKAANPPDTATIKMNAGVPVDFELDYFQAGGTASAVLSWSNAMGTEPLAVIPTSAFSPQ
jgi:hypothetical protein